MNWSEFFDMGGYAFYVWTSWGLTALAMCWLFMQAKLRNAKIRSDIKRQMSREALLRNKS
jgi:heme exporter protein D